MAILVKPVQPLKPLQPLQPLQAKQMLTPFSQLKPLVPIGTKDPYMSYAEKQRRARLKAQLKARYELNSWTDVLFNEEAKNQLISGTNGNPYQMDYLSKAVLAGTNMMKKQFADPWAKGDSVQFITNGINMFSEDMDVLSNFTKGMVIESGSVDSSLIVGAMTGLAAGVATILSGGTLAPVFFATTIAAGVGMVGNALVSDTEGALRGLEKAAGSSILGKTNYNFDIKNGFVNLAAEIAIDPLNWLSYGQNLVTNMADIWGMTINETALGAINMLGSIDNLVTKVAVRSNPIGWIWKGAKAGFDFANSPAMRMLGVTLADLHDVLKDVPISQMTATIDKTYKKVMGQKNAVLGRWAKTGELDALTKVDETEVYNWFSKSRDALVQQGFSLDSAYGMLNDMAKNNLLYEFAAVGGVGMRDEVRAALTKIMDEFSAIGGITKGAYYGATDPKQLKALDQWLQAMAEQTVAVDMVRDIMDLKISPILDAANKELQSANFGTVVTRGQKLDAFYKELVASDPTYAKLEFLLKDNNGNRALDRALRVRGFSLDELYQRVKSPVNDVAQAKALLHDLPDYSSAVKPDGKLMADAERVRKYTQKSLEAAQLEMSQSGSQLYYGKVIDGQHEGSWDVSGAPREDFYVRRAFEIEVDTANTAMNSRGTNTYYGQMMDWKKKINETNQTLFGPLREIRRQIQSGPKGFKENLFMRLSRGEQNLFMDVTKAYEDLYDNISNYDIKWDAYQRYLENPKGYKVAIEDPGRVIAKANGVLRSLAKEEWTNMMKKFNGTVTEDFMRTVFETIPQLGLKDAADALIKETTNAMVLQLNISRQIELIISEVTKSVFNGHSGIEMLQDLLDTSSKNSMGRLLEAISGFDIRATAEFAELGRAARNIKAQGEGFTNIMRYIKRITDVLDARNLQEPMKPTFLAMDLPVNVLGDDGSMVTAVMDTADDMFTLRGLKDSIEQELKQLDDPMEVAAKQGQLEEVTQQMADLKESQYLALREAKQQVVDLQGRILADYANVKPLEQAYTQLFKPEGVSEIMDAADNAVRVPLIKQGESLVAKMDEINTQLDELEVLQGKLPVDPDAKALEEYDRASLLAPPKDPAALLDPESDYNKTFRSNFQLEDNTVIKKPSEHFSFQKGQGARLSRSGPARDQVEWLEWPDNKSFSFVKSAERMLPSGMQVPAPVLFKFNELVRKQPPGEYNVQHLFDMALYADPAYATKYRQLQSVMPKRVQGAKDILKTTKDGYLVNGMRNAGLTESFLMKFYGTRKSLLEALNVDMDAYKIYQQTGKGKPFVVKLKSGKSFAIINDKGILRIPGEMLADFRDELGKAMNPTLVVKATDVDVAKKATKAIQDTLKELYKYGYIKEDLFKSNLSGTFPSKLFFENEDPWSIFKSPIFGLDDKGTGSDAIGSALMKLRTEDVTKRTKWSGDTLVSPKDADTILSLGASEELGKGIKPVTVLQHRRFQREAMQQWVTRNPKVLTNILAYDEKALIGQFGIANYTMHIKPIRESLALFFPERMLALGDTVKTNYGILNWDVQEIRDFLRYNTNSVKVNEQDMYRLFTDVVQHYAPLKGVKMTVDAAFKKGSMEQKVLNTMAEISMYATRGKMWDPDLITVVGRDGTVYEGVKHITYSIAQAEKWARKNARANSTAMVNGKLMMSRSIPQVDKVPVKEVTYAEYLTQIKEARRAVNEAKAEIASVPTYKQTMDDVIALRKERNSLSELSTRLYESKHRDEVAAQLLAVHKRLQALKHVEDAATATNVAQNKLAKAQNALMKLEAHPVAKGVVPLTPEELTQRVSSYGSNHNSPRFNSGAAVIMDLPESEAKKYLNVGPGFPDKVPVEYVKGVADTQTYITNGDTAAAMNSMRKIPQESGTVRVVHWTSPGAAQDIQKNGFKLGQGLAQYSDLLADNTLHSEQIFEKMLEDGRVKHGLPTPKPAVVAPVVDIPAKITTLQRELAVAEQSVKRLTKDRIKAGKGKVQVDIADTPELVAYRKEVKAYKKKLAALDKAFAAEKDINIQREIQGEIDWLMTEVPVFDKAKALRLNSAGVPVEGKVKDSFNMTKLIEAREKVERLKMQMSVLTAQQKSLDAPKIAPITRVAENEKKSLIFNDQIEDVVVRPYTVHIPESTTDGIRTIYDETYLEDGTIRPSVETINVPKFKPARDVTIKEHMSNTTQATGPRQYKADYWAGIQRAKVQKPKPYKKWNEWKAPTQTVLLPAKYQDLASRVDLTNARTDRDIITKFREFTEKHRLVKPDGDNELAMQIRAKIKELSDTQAENFKVNDLLEKHVSQSNTLKNKALEKWYFETTGKRLNFWEIKKLANNPTGLSPVEAALKELKAEGYHEGEGIVLSKKLSNLRPEGINVGPTMEMFNNDDVLKRRVYNYVFDMLIKHNETPLTEANIILRDYTKISDQIMDVFPELKEYGGKALTDELQRVVYMFLDDQMKWAHLNPRLINVVDTSFLQDMSLFMKRIPEFITTINDPAFQQDALMERFNAFRAMFATASGRSVTGKGGVGYVIPIPKAIDSFGEALNRIHDMNVKAATEYVIESNPTLYNETAHAFGLTHIEDNIHTKAIIERQERTGKVFQDSEALMKRNLAIKEAKLGQPASLDRSSKQLMRELTLTTGANMDLALKSYKEVIDARWALATGDFTSIGRQDIADIITNAQVNSSDVFRNIEEMRRMAIRYPAEAGYFLKKDGLDVMAKREVSYIEQQLTAEQVAQYIYFHKPSHFWAFSNDTITDGLNVEVIAELRNKYGMVIGGDAEFTTYRFIAGQETPALKELKPLAEMFPQRVSDLPDVMIKQGNLFDGKMQKASGVLNPFHWTDSMRVRYDGDKLAAFYKARGFITEAETPQFIVDMQNQMNLWNSFTGSSAALKKVFGDRGFIGSPLNAMIATSTSLTTHGANKMTFLDNIMKGSWAIEDAFAVPGLPKPTAAQILKAYQTIPSLTAIVISKDMRIIELPIRNIRDVNVALKNKAFLTSGDTISRMWNEFDNGKISPIIQGLSNYIQGPYKAGYLSHLGLGVRNMGDNIKALIMMSRNNRDVMPFIPRAFKAMQDYQKILLALEGKDDLARAEYLLKLTDKQLVDYAIIRSASETVMNTHLESIMDITAEARKASEIRKAVRGKNIDVMGAIWGNPLTRTALKVQGFGENLGRAAGLFYALEVKGMGGSAAADYVNKFFFDYNKKGKAMTYLSTFVPFAFFPAKNFLLWAEEAEKNPTLFRFFLDMGTMSWNGGVQDRGYAMTAYEQQQQISGNFKVGSTLIKFNPSLFDAMALIPDVLQHPTERLSPMITNVEKLMKGDIDGIELPFQLNYERVSKIVGTTIPKLMDGNVEEAPNMIPSLFSAQSMQPFKSPTTTYSYTNMSRRYGSGRIPRSASYIKKVYLSKGFYNTLYTKAGKSRIGIRLQTKPSPRNLAGRIKDNSYMFK